MAGRFDIETVFRARDRMTAPIARMRNEVVRLTASTRASVFALNSAFASTNSALMSVATGGLAAVGLAAAGAYHQIRQFTDAADELSKTAARLQFPIENLQEWRFVASQSGVPTEDLTKSLTIFAKSLGAAKKGTGPLVSSMKNTNAQLLRQLVRTDDVSEAFEIYLQAMHNTKGAAAQTEMAAAAFGKSGAKMINVASMTADEISKLREEARQNGIITLQAAQDAEAFNDSVDSLKMSVAGLRNSAIAPMLPAMTEMSDRMRLFILANRELIGQKIKETMQFITDHFDDFKNVLSGTLGLLKIYLAVMISVRAATIAWTIATAIHKALMVVWTAITWAAVAAIWAYNAAVWVAKLRQEGWTLRLVLGHAAMMLIRGGMIAFAAAAAIYNGVMGLATFATTAFGIALNLGLLPITLIILAIGALVGAIALLWYNWDSIAAFFSESWEGIKSVFSGAVDYIMKKLAFIIDPLKKIKAGLSGIFGGFSVPNMEVPVTMVPQGIPGMDMSMFGGMMPAGDRTEQAQNYVTMPDRVSREINENRDSMDININDGTGRAEVSKAPRSPNVSLNMQRSGVF